MSTTPTINESVSLRDYLAAHAPMPEPGFIYEALGWEMDLKIGSDDDIGADSWQDTMMTRWHELPTAKRMAICARHAYVWADAMLAARDLNHQLGS